MITWLLTRLGALLGLDNKLRNWWLYSVWKKQKISHEFIVYLGKQITDPPEPGTCLYGGYTTYHIYWKITNCTDNVNIQIKSDRFPRSTEAWVMELSTKIEQKKYPGKFSQGFGYHFVSGPPLIISRQAVTLQNVLLTKHEVEQWKQRFNDYDRFGFRSSTDEMFWIPDEVMNKFKEQLHEIPDDYDPNIITYDPSVDRYIVPETGKKYKTRKRAETERKKVLKRQQEETQKHIEELLARQNKVAEEQK